ncbi:DUF4233 domain-containing protein [Mobilicoccus caccae]|uniref:DUF4233 domain-containing protein n=1 Tax=Mobilicoccus caccae TaxID=1859295 RepID=A0ABQ6IQX0_9MICO|nr:DUF4233 domain-containing protein [Mobilicoccus caccae]GMA39119.1 hypothetical protein GCM10025883_11640 [Mobilicoccus caccae]
MATSLPFHGMLGPMQRRLGAIVLGSQVPVIVFGALAVWGLASAQDDPRAGVFLASGFGLALASIVAAALLRRPFGVTLGWVVQIAMFASAVIAPVIVLVAGIFMALWVTALVQGFKMDLLTARREAARAETA